MHVPEPDITPLSQQAGERPEPAVRPVTHRPSEDDGGAVTGPEISAGATSSPGHSVCGRRWDSSARCFASAIHRAASRVQRDLLHA